MLYIDSSNETWNDSPDVLHLTWGRYVAKEQAIQKIPGRPAALISHGANPGLVNHFVKHAIMEMAREEYGQDYAKPKTQEEWAQLAKKLEIQLIQISERDTQVSNIVRAPGEFCSTWCPSAMMDESSEPSQVPLGTHEPRDVVVPNRPLASVREQANVVPTWFSGNWAAANLVKSWNPVCGPFCGNLIPHDETFSISKYLTPADGSYRPTMYFAYQASNDALLSLRDWAARYPADPDRLRLLLNDISQGQDILGVLVARKGRSRVLWYGSLMDVHAARSRLANTQATTLSVIASVLAGVVYVVNNPRIGFVEPDDIDYEAILHIATPYITPMTSSWGEWTTNEGNAISDDMWTLQKSIV